jgi:transcriptional regulator of acetoin/glycerol metabolism
LAKARCGLTRFAWADGSAALDDSARSALVGHAWPGNVRELKNVLQRAALLCQSGVITAHDLGLVVARGNNMGCIAPAVEPDREIIESALKNARGVISQAAAELGLSRQALYRRMDKLGIESGA